jgi:hypothetical protein
LERRCQSDVCLDELERAADVRALTYGIETVMYVGPSNLLLLKNQDRRLDFRGPDSGTSATATYSCF